MAGSLYRCSHLASRRSQKIIERNIHSSTTPHDGYAGPSWAPTAADTLYMTAKNTLYRETFVRKHPGFQAAEVEAWATLTGDANPIHTSASAASDAGVMYDYQSCAASFERFCFPQFLTA